MEKVVRKLKRSSKTLRYIYYFISIFYLITLILFVKNLISLKGIETAIRVIVIILFISYFFVYLVVNFFKLLQKKYKFLIISSVIALLFSVIFSIGSYYIKFAYDKLGNMTDKKDLLYTTYLITLKDSKFDGSAAVGLINGDTEAKDHALGESLYADKKLSNKIKDYDDYLSLISDLYNGKIEAIFVPGNYVTLFSSEEAYENIDKDTKIVYEYSQKMNNDDLLLTSDKDFSEPLTFLLMGVDSTENGLEAASSFNGDTLMLVSFNPKTLSVLMLSIPRDTYVPIACRNNQYAKINSAAAYGANCVISTISNFLDIGIDYYVKINFKGVVSLVDAVGGVEVDVEKPYFNYSNEEKYKGKMCEQNSNRQFGEHLVCVDPGVHVLNGEEALAYSRNRHLYIGGDLDRVRHQQQVVEALAKKLLKFSSISDLQNILQVVSSNLATNMETDKILSGYQVAKNVIGNVISGEDPITINKAYLETYSLPVYLPTSGMYTSAQGYYQNSLDDITKAFKQTLDITAKEEIKTFSFSVNEPYEIYSPGKSKRSGEPYSLVSKLIGKTVTDAEEYASSKGFSLKVEYVDSDSSYYDSSIAAGLIASQVPHAGELILGNTELTVYVNNASSSGSKTAENKVEEEKKTEKEDKKEEKSSEKDEEIVKKMLE